MYHKTLVDIRDMCARPGTMCARFFVSGINSRYRLHVFIDLSLDPSGILTVMDLISDCKFFTGIPGRTKFTVATASDIASLLVIFMINVEYALSIFMCLVVDDYNFFIIFIFISGC